MTARVGAARWTVGADLLSGLAGRCERLPASVRRAVWIALGGLLGAAVLGTALVYLLMVEPTARLDQARADGLAAARSRTQELLSYTPSSLDADLAHARDGVSGDFAAQFGQLQAQLIVPAVRAGLSTRATVVRASVVRAERDRVVTLLFLDQRSTKEGTAPTVTPSRLEVTVVRVGGQWLVADMRNL
jgi:Mce-associated membrane protein